MPYLILDNNQDKLSNISNESDNQSNNINKTDKQIYTQNINKKICQFIDNINKEKNRIKNDTEYNKSNKSDIINDAYLNKKRNRDNMNYIYNKYNNKNYAKKDIDLNIKNICIEKDKYIKENKDNNIKEMNEYIEKLIKREIEIKV